MTYEHSLELCNCVIILVPVNTFGVICAVTTLWLLLSATRLIDRRSCTDLLDLGS